MANIVKAHILGADENAVDAAGRSTQLPEDSWDYNKTGAKEPPYNLDALCVFLEINTWHYRCVKAKAVSTAGLGFDFVVPEGVKEPKPENKQTLKAFFNHPNDEMTWGEILENGFGPSPAGSNTVTLRELWNSGIVRGFGRAPLNPLPFRAPSIPLVLRLDLDPGQPATVGHDPLEVLSLIHAFDWLGVARVWRAAMPRPESRTDKSA